jgi:hypothetical protein
MPRPRSETTIRKAEFAQGLVAKDPGITQAAMGEAVTVRFGTGLRSQILANVKAGRDPFEGTSRAKKRGAKAETKAGRRSEVTIEKAAYARRLVEKEPSITSRALAHAVKARFGSGLNQAIVTAVKLGRDPFESPTTADRAAKPLASRGGAARPRDARSEAAPYLVVVSHSGIPVDCESKDAASAAVVRLLAQGHKLEEILVYKVMPIHIETSYEVRIGDVGDAVSRTRGRPPDRARRLPQRKQGEKTSEPPAATLKSGVEPSPADTTPAAAAEPALEADPSPRAVAEPGPPPGRDGDEDRGREC